MEDSSRRAHDRRPVTSTVSTTTVHGPHTTTTTSSTAAGQGTIVTDYGSQSTTVAHPTITTTTNHTPDARLSPVPPNSNRLRSSSIRIRRPASREDVPSSQPAAMPPPAADSSWQAGRRRSSSEPRPPSGFPFQDDAALRRQLTATPMPLQPLQEEGTQAGTLAPTSGPPPSRGPSTRRQGLNRQISAINIRRKDNRSHENTMGANVVDVLDVIGRFTMMLSNLTCG